jgi:tryptophanyl-tRNA synthetase
MAKPILISGIQPTGRLHLGNYLGALKNFAELQNSNKYDCYFFIADPKKSTIFVQSHVPESAELAWILSTITPPGELSRMTQLKDKSKNDPDNINMGLIFYPVLMTADILLYGAKFVPVGEDQLQHLELTRTLARKFNNKFGKIFTEPQALLTKTPRVMSLNNPDKKMSKSLPEGCLFLDDSPEEIEKKIKRAVTDSGSEVKYDPENKSGISNLLEIYSVLSEKSIPELEKKYAGKGYGQLKNDLAVLTIDSLKSFRGNKTSESALKKHLKIGGGEAKKIASKKIKEVKKKLGLL